MASHDSNRRPQKKSARTKKARSPIFNLEIVAHLRRQMDHRLPNLGRQLASFIRVSREKLDDIYSSAAQAVTEHKEAFEDRLAEKKAQARAATRATQQQGAPSRPIRRGARGTVKDGTVKSSAVRLASKRPTRSSAKPRS